MGILTPSISIQFNISSSSNSDISSFNSIFSLMYRSFLNKISRSSILSSNTFGSFLINTLRIVVNSSSSIICQVDAFLLNKYTPLKESNKAISSG